MSPIFFCLLTIDCFISKAGFFYVPESGCPNKTVLPGQGTPGDVISFTPARKKPEMERPADPPARRTCRICAVRRRAKGQNKSILPKKQERNLAI